LLYDERRIPRTQVVRFSHDSARESAKEDAAMKALAQFLSDRRDRRPGDAGFTLMELLIVISIMLILMLIAIPNMLNLRATANETSAKQSLRAIQIAENQYATNFPANGFACSLTALGGNASSGPPSPQSAQLLQSDLAGGNKAGYTFNIVNCQKAPGSQQDDFVSYEVTAVPQVVGKTGHSGFCLDMSGEIKSDPAGGTNCTVPIQ
jgi:type IV pilus assembly protein PilA